MTPQSTFMIMAGVSEGKLEKLRTLLATMNRVIAHADPENKLIPFGQFDRLHFARFTIIEAKTADEVKAFGLTPRPWQPTLTFFGDFDGDRDSFLSELVEKAGSGIKKILSHCDGVPEAEYDLLKWLQGNNIKPEANYINWVGRTVKQVHEEAALHKSLSTYLQEIVDDVGRKNTLEIRQMLLSHVEMQKHTGKLTLTPPEATPFLWKVRNLMHMIGVPLVLLLLSPLFLLIAPFFIIRLRMLERSDPELFIRPSREHIKQLTVQEDWEVTNQYNVFGDIKPGPFRLWTFKTILFMLDYTARHIFNRGFLTRIKTIHFARWVLVDNNRRAFFVSNYDGSHESYMDDFINKVGWGLNIIFSHAVPYPTTNWLIKDGAYREQQFKYTQRLHQLPTEVWYKAYPDLSAADLARNSRIRQGVENRQASVEEIREWLRLI